MASYIRYCTNIKEEIGRKDTFGTLQNILVEKRAHEITMRYWGRKSRKYILEHILLMVAATVIKQKINIKNCHMFMYFNSDCAQMLHLVGSPVDAVYPPWFKHSTLILSTRIRYLIAEKAREQSCDNSSIITIAKLLGPAKCLSIHSWIKKTRYICSIW